MADIAAENELPGTSLTRLPRAAVLAAGDARLRASLLGEYLDVLADAADGARRLSSHELERYRSLGRAAAEAGAALRALVDLYLSATWRAWPTLPAVAGASDLPELRAAGTAVLRASDDVVAALCEGYESARAARARAEEAARRELVDDLLTGTSDVGSLIERASVFGLRLEAPHVVLVVRASRRFADGRVITRDVEALLRARSPEPGPADLLVATKDGLLVCVVPAAAADETGLGPGVGAQIGAGDGVADVAAGAGVDAEDAGGARRARIGSRNSADDGPDDGPARRREGRGSTYAALIADRMARESDLIWRLGVGRARRGVGGVRAGFEEARWAIDVGGPPRPPEPVAHAENLLVYQVLLRDRPALEELVATVLTGLRQARGGPGPLLGTLTAYLDSGGVTLVAARRLHLSPRAVTYRLARITELTGYDPDDADDRYALQTAALGARLLGWPETA